jgi:hypothetical protein
VPDDLFAALYGDTADLPAPGVNDVRTRARRHTRNRRLAVTGATFAVLVMVAGGVAFAGRGTGPEPPPPLSSAEPAPSATGTPSPVPSAGSPSAGAPSSPSSSPGRPPLTKVPAGAMLRAEDLTWTQLTAQDNPENESGDGTLPAILSQCADFYPSPDNGSTELDNFSRRFSRPQHDDGALQRTVLFSSESAAKKQYDWLREGVDTCGSFKHKLDEQIQTTLTTTPVSAGDRAFIVTATSPYHERTYVVVQVGRMWTEVDIPKAHLGQAPAVAQKAAERMRNAQR